MYIRKNGEIIRTNPKKQVEKFNFRPVESYDTMTSDSQLKIPVWAIALIVLILGCLSYMLFCYIKKRRGAYSPAQKFGFKFY